MDLEQDESKKQHGEVTELYWSLDLTTEIKQISLKRGLQWRAAPETIRIAAVFSKTQFLQVLNLKIHPLENKARKNGSADT
jgi:hypothetical protein